MSQSESTKNQNKSGNVLDWQLFKRVVALAKPFKVQFIIATFLALLLAGLSPLRPYLVQLTVDNYILVGDGKGLSRMTMLLVFMLALESVCRYQFGYLTSWLGQSVIKNLRVSVFTHILNFRLRYFDTTPIGTSTTRAINDVEAVNDVFSEGMITIIADLFTIIMVLSIMFYTDWRLTFVCMTTFPLLVYATYLFKEGIKKTFQEVRTQVARMNAFLQEHISGMGVVQIFAAEQQEMDKFKEINQRQTDANIHSIWYYSVFFPAVEIIIATALGLLVWYGAHSVISNYTTLGVLIAFILYLNMLFYPMRMLADKFNTLQMGMVASERVFSVLDRDEKIADTGKLTASFEGNIGFSHVWFSYNDKDWVLRDVNFEVQKGQTLAIVGATGAGKSSIINILNRFYDIQQGTITIDGTDIKDYTLDSLRSNIGLVLQDVFLFSGSVLENITLRNPDINREQVIHAAKMMGADEFIEKLPGGYDYQVMERGATLSMGQRQMISFIRALVFNPRILILDEATSSIDTETEQMVQYAMDKLVQNRTAIIIAHRLSTIQHAHQIIVLDKGKIVEMGNHESLLELNGQYRKLHDTQFGALIEQA
ncbi:MAG: ABC transporter ATP-binding protein [Sphingobacteriales bacterium]|nr:MAG: ABC transporter ATP-binding protein [Sphingobacteriales bacterium]